MRPPAWPCGDFRKIDAQMNDGLCNLRTDAADQAIRAHQARSATVFSKCWGYQGSTTGTPVMSMMA